MKAELKQILKKLDCSQDQKDNAYNELCILFGVMCCGECGTEVDETDYKDEHCLSCGNDLLMGAWATIPKKQMDEIMAIRRSCT